MGPASARPSSAAGPGAIVQQIGAKICPVVFPAHPGQFDSHEKSPRPRFTLHTADAPSDDCTLGKNRLPAPANILHYARPHWVSDRGCRRIEAAFEFHFDRETGWQIHARGLELRCFGDRLRRTKTDRGFRAVLPALRKLGLVSPNLTRRNASTRRLRTVAPGLQGPRGAATRSKPV